MDHITPEAIREFLQHTRNKYRVDAGLKPAAVLIPLFYKDNELHILFTERTQSVESHKGEVSFPGGMREKDDSSMQETALRETFEEVGIPADKVEILGKMDDFPTITGFIVTPFVGFFPYPVKFKINRNEVESLLEVPLRFFTHRSNYRYMKRSYKSKEYLLEYFEWDGKIIWGATSRILMNFLEVTGLKPV